MKTSTADTAAFTQIDLPRAGATLLRVALGIMFIAHSVVLKYVTYTLAGTADGTEEPADQGDQAPDDDLR